MSLSSRFVVSLVCAALLLGSCTDDVTCVFSATGCNGSGSGAIATNPAALPVDGQWIVDDAPKVERVAPAGLLNPGTTPVVVVFSESIIPDTLNGAVEIVPTGSGPTLRTTQALVADGRVLVLLPLPTPPVAAGAYKVRLSQQASITDLTGQKLGLAAGAEIGSFSVSSTPPTTPRLVATFPADASTGQSETGQIVVVLDRPVVPTSVDSSSFDVRVGGANPPNDPLPTALVPDGSPAADPRVFLYRSVDARGVPAALGTNVQVQLSLSPASDPIIEQDNGILPPVTISFRTLVFAAPRSASLLSLPVDAIGRANLTDGDPEELELQVDLDGGQPGDFVDLFLTGNKRSSVAADRILIAVQRSVGLAGTAPISVATFQREDIPLQLSSDPGDTRFQDGPVTFALRTRRGSLVSPVRLLDLDPDPDTIQDPALDTVVPRVVSLARPGLLTSVFFSDQRGISLAGLASETLRSAQITTPLGNTQAHVAGSANNLFLAAPIPAGILATGTTTYSLVARDAAANASTTHNGVFTQFGAVGPGAFTPGQTIDVQVFDGGTLKPLANALVLVHSDQGNGTFPFVIGGSTSSDGRMSLPTAGAPSVGAIVTVVHPDYDLFTLHGVPSTRLSVPLRPKGSLGASASGAVRTTDPAAIAVLPGIDRRIDDSCRSARFARGFAGQAPVPGSGSVTFAYGPKDIVEEQLGALSFFAGDFTQSEASFSAPLLLQAFALTLPLAPAQEGDAQVAVLEVPSLLTDSGTPAADVVQPLPPCVLTIDANAGVDLLDLEDDAGTTGEPFVTVETRVPGLSGSIAVAQGLAFTQGANRWNVRAALPGTITAGGTLGAQGSVDTDPSLRIELRDVDGNVAGVRPRLSAILAGGPSPEFRALATADLLAPASGAHSGGGAFDLVLRHAITDDRGVGGVYRVDLVDPNGRGWTLYRVDPSGTADVELHVVDVVADGGAVGLATGTITARVAAYGWASFDPTAFLWTDIERDFEVFSFTAPTSFLEP